MTQKWLEKYISDLQSKKLTLEDVIRLHREETGKTIKVKTIKKHLNDMGFSVKEFIVGVPGEDIAGVPGEDIAEAPGEEKQVPCRSCKYWRLGSCYAPVQTYQGWLDKFDEGYCPLKKEV